MAILTYKDVYIMYKKLALALGLLSTSCISQAGILKFDTSITGADMGGIQVTATFADNSYETVSWDSISSVLGNTGNDIVDHEGYSGGVFGTDWSLTQKGYTLGNVNAGNIFGAWSFIDNALSSVTSLKIDTNNTDIMFDTATFGDIAEDANGSGQGRRFMPDSVLPISGTYSDNVQQELYKILEISGLAGDDFEFLADTDKEDDTATAVVVINEEELVSANEVVSGADIDAVEAVLTADPSNPALVAYLADPANDAASLLEAVANLDLAALPPEGTEAEELELAAAIQVAQSLIKEQLKDPGTGSVTGNGDIEVEIDRDSGEVAIVLTVADEDATTLSLDFITILDTPEFAFSLNFDFDFTTDSGSLEVFLAGDLLASYLASDFLNASGFGSLFVSDAKYFGLTGAELKYSLFPGSPASISLSNINVTSVVPTEVPEPSTIFILMSGLLGLMVSRKKRAGK